MSQEEKQRLRKEKKEAKKAKAQSKLEAKEEVSPSNGTIHV